MTCSRAPKVCSNLSCEYDPASADGTTATTLPSTEGARSSPEDGRQRLDEGFGNQLGRFSHPEDFVCDDDDVAVFGSAESFGVVGWESFECIVRVPQSSVVFELIYEATPLSDEAGKGSGSLPFAVRDAACCVA